MSVLEFLTELRTLDVHVTLEGERLRLNAPAGALSDTHRDRLQRHKEEIIEFLRTARQLSLQQKAIVPLQPTGSYIPVFAVAGHNGDVFCYRHISQHLGPDQPFFGLQPPGLEEGSEPLVEVESLAGYFAQQIREVRPTGPYTIAGFCAGGTVAFELARQLSDNAASHVRLVLFGAPFSTSYRAMPQLLATSSYFARRSIVHARAMLTLPAAERSRYFSDRVRVLRPAEDMGSTDAVMNRRVAVEKATMTAVRRYEPSRFDGHIDLMLPSESWKNSADAPTRWSKMAASCSQFVGPDGCDGDNMLLPEHAAIFAALFKRARDAKLNGS